MISSIYTVVLTYTVKYSVVHCVVSSLPPQITGIHFKPHICKLNIYCFISSPAQDSELLRSWTRSLAVSESDETCSLTVRNNIKQCESLCHVSYSKHKALTGQNDCTDGGGVTISTMARASCLRTRGVMNNEERKACIYLVNLWRQGSVRSRLGTV